METFGRKQKMREKEVFEIKIISKLQNSETKSENKKILRKEKGKSRVALHWRSTRYLVGSQATAYIP